MTRRTHPAPSREECRQRMRELFGNQRLPAAEIKAQVDILFPPRPRVKRVAVEPKPLTDEQIDDVQLGVRHP